MPVLAAWLTSLFSSLTVYFAARLSQKTAMIAAAIVTFTAMLTALYAGLGAIAAGISVSMPNAALAATGIWLFVPYNAPVCVALMVAADTALSLFFWQQVHLNIATKAI